MRPCVSVSKAIEGFLLRKSAEGLSPYTLRNYQTDLARLSSFLEAKTLQDVEPADLERFLGHLRGLSTMRFGKVGTKRVSAKTVRNAWGTLSVFWKWAADEFDLPNPLRVRMPKVPTKEIEPFTREEVKRLLAAAGDKTRATRIRDTGLLLAPLDTGYRVSELASCTNADYEPETGALLLRYTKGGHGAVRVLGKGGEAGALTYTVRRGEVGP